MCLSSNKLSRRDFLRGAAVAGVGAALAACVPQAPAANNAGSVDNASDMEASPVSFLAQGGSESAFNRYNPLIDSFHEANGDIVVETVWEPGGAIEVQVKLLTLIAAGQAPDVYWAHSYTNAGQAKRDIQLDLSEMIASDDSIAEADFLPAAWQDFHIGGKQIGFPRETTSTIIIYNKERFEANNVALPTADWTWADFENAAGALTQGDGAEKIFGIADFNLNRNTWIKLWQKGGDVLNDDRSAYTMNEAANVEQVQLIADWHHKLGVHVSGVEKGGFSTGDLFTTGRIAMFPQFSVFTNVLPAEFEWDIAHMPLDADDRRTTRVASAGHSIYAGTTVPEAAWKFITHLESEEAFRHYVSTGLSLPSLKVVAESFIDPNKPPAQAQIMLDAFDYGRPEPVAGDWIGVHREIQPALDSIYGLEQTDPQATLDGIADRVNELIAFVPEL